MGLQRVRLIDLRQVLEMEKSTGITTAAFWDDDLAMRTESTTASKTVAMKDDMMVLLRGVSTRGMTTGLRGAGQSGNDWVAQIAAVTAVTMAVM